MKRFFKLLPLFLYVCHVQANMLDTVGLRRTSDDKPFLLRELMSVHDKGIMINFWTSKNADTVRCIPRMLVIAKELYDKRVRTSVVFVNVEATSKARKHAELERTKSRPIEQQFSCPWLYEYEAGVLAKSLGVKDEPCLVIFSDKGEILYQGSPDDEETWRAVIKM